MGKVRTTCYYCNAPLTRNGKNRRTWDHRVPKSRGGTNDSANLVDACYTCNQMKGMLTDDEYKAVLSYRAFKANMVAGRPQDFVPLVTELNLEDHGMLYEMGIKY